MKKIYLSLLLLMLGSPALMAQIYVTEAGAGLKNGTSWANAYDNTQLQQAINEAESATTKQVWVAKGTYKPTESLSTTGFLTDGITPVTARDNAFILKTAVEIYGGFAGGESAIIDRVNINTTNETILSGDLNNNDTADDGDSYHVVSSKAASLGAVLDGFTIQYGFANGSGSITEAGVEINQNNGGGIGIRGENTGASFMNLIIKNCEAANNGGGAYTRGSGSGASGVYIFDKVWLNNNKALRGGGAYMDVSGGSHKGEFTNCEFNNNEGTGTGSGDGGGALFCANGNASRTVSVLNSRFTGNTSEAYGGAMRVNDETTVNLTNSTFEDGVGEVRGGGIYSTGSSIVNMNTCNFKNNQSNGAGGHYYLFSGTLNIDNSTLETGSSVGSGGVVYVNSGNLSVVSSIFNNNSSTTTGGVFYIYAGTVTISGSTFTENMSTTSGGVLYNLTGTVDIQKSKFYSNIANNSGGVFYVTAGANNPSITTVSNSLFYNNLSRTTSTGAAGGGLIYHTRGTSGVISTVTMINNVFYANKSVNENATYSFNSVADVKINLYNNIFHGNLSNYDEVNGTGLTPTSVDVRRFTAAVQVYSNNIFQSSITTSGSRTVTNAYTLAAEPLFASTTPTDYNFLWPVEGGFSLDKGDNALYTTNVGDVNTATDLLNNARANGIIDLGAIEWASVLPVTISSFSGNLANNRTQLKWSVGTEENVNRYEVERSNGSANFVKVAEVLANGSSSYATIDANPQLGDNYYRLKTVDNDGTYSYYGQVLNFKVASLGTEEFKVYPNPVQGRNVSVSLSGYPTGTYTYKLINASGSVVQQGTLNNDGSSATFTLSPSVSKGVYILQLDNGASTKLIKQ